MTTDIERRLAWKEVQNLIRISDPDWPDALPSCDIAKLHAFDGLEVERIKADAFESFLDEEIAAGRLHAETVMRKEWPLVYSLGEDVPDWEISRELIRAEDVAIALPGFEFGRYLAEWLRPFMPTASGVDDLAWRKARQLRGLRLTPEEMSAGWPEFFSLERLALLQYPDEGSDPERKKARRNRTALYARIKESIQAGTLQAGTRHRAYVSSKTQRQVWHSVNPSAASWMDPSGWGSAKVVSCKVKTGEQIVAFSAIGRAAFAAFLASEHEEPSEHIRAWLRPLEQEQKDMAPEQAVKSLPDEKCTVLTKHEIIDRLGRYTELRNAWDRKKDKKPAFFDQAKVKRGRYILEIIEAGCREMWPREAVQRGRDDLTLVGMFSKRR